MTKYKKERDSGTKNKIFERIILSQDASSKEIFVECSDFLARAIDALQPLCEKLERTECRSKVHPTLGSRFWKEVANAYYEGIIALQENRLAVIHSQILIDLAEIQLRSERGSSRSTGPRIGQDS